ncbi:MAG: vgrG, partial [Rhodocyclales bacterium]|nr:vgrG [Rhodocyclales bacterium]
RQNASGTQLDSRVAPNQLEAAQSLVTTLADSAQKQKAELTGEPAPDKHPSVEALVKSQEIIATTETGNAPSESVGGGAGTVPAWSEPMIVAESPAGIAALTPKSAVLVAGNTLTLVAADIHIASQGKQAWAVKDGIALYTYGKQSDTKRPVKDTGLKLHAAKGKVSVQAQSDKADFNADKAVTITSTTADVLLQGKGKLLLTAGGAGIEIAGGDITLTASGTVDLKAAQRNLSGGKSASGGAITLPAPTDLDIPKSDSKPAPHSLRFAARGADEAMADAGLHELPYKVFNADGVTISQGTVPATGRLPEIKANKPEHLVLQMGDANATKLEELSRSTTSNAAAAESDEDDGTIDVDSNSPQAHKSRYSGEVYSAANKQHGQFLPESLIEQLLSEATDTKS